LILEYLINQCWFIGRELVIKMIKMKRYFFVLVILNVILLLTLSALPVAGASVGANGSRYSGSVNVPQWEKGDKWGYKIPQYAYSSDYYGVGFEVMGTETVDGNECYKVKIWWDASFGAEENGYELDMDIPGFSYSYRYEGFVYYTKDKLAIAKFTMELQMRMQYDGSKFTTSYITRAQDGYDISDYTDYLEKMKKWKYDINYDFSIGYTYTPPFVMNDYPLELNKRWNSTSEVEVTWEYSTHIWMNSAMKNDIDDMYGGEYQGIDASDEEGSDTAQFTLTGSFEVTGEDTIETATGSHEVFTIAYDISMGFTRGTYTTPPESYGGMSVPGGDATLNLIGGSAGDGTSYFDAESGYAQKMDTGSYYTESYATVEPSTIENSYDDVVDSKRSGGGDSDSSANNILFYLAAVIGTVVLLVIIMVIVLMKRSNRQQYQQGQYQHPQERYPQQSQQQPQQSQQYPQEQYPRKQYPPQGSPQQQYPPQRPENPQQPGY
jgi:hypothetical protein